MVPGGFIAALDLLARLVYDPLREGGREGCWFFRGEEWRLCAVLDMAEQA